MPWGPGKYDELATHVQEQTGARGVLLAVIGGKLGEGFSVQASADVLVALPAILRTIADQIEAGVAS